MFPFHSWLHDVCSKESGWKFNIIMINVLLGFSLVFISPISKLLIVIPNYFAWYGVIFSLVATLIGVLTTKDLDKQIMIFTSTLGLLLICLGSGNIASAFQILLMIPFAFLGLMIFSVKLPSNNEISSSENKAKTVIKLVLDTLIFSIVGISIIAVIPFSSSLLNIGYLFTTTSIDSSLVVYVLAIISLLGIFLIYVQISRKYYEQKLYKTQKLSQLIPLSLIIVILSLNSILYPIFNILNPYSLPVDFANESLSIALIPIFVGWFVILLLYITSELLVKKISTKLSKFSDSIQNTLRDIYLFEFIIRPLDWLRVNAIIPFAILFYEYFIRDFIYKLVILSIARFFVFLAKTTRDFIKDIAIPQTINLFKTSSNFIRSLENAKLKTQLLYIILSLGILIAVVIILYAGGMI
jgi:hypothetical protein